MALLLPTYIHPRTRARHPDAYLVVDPPVFRHEARVAEITYRIWGSVTARQEGGVPIFEHTIEATGQAYTALVNRVTSTLETQLKSRLYPDAQDAP